MDRFLLPIERLLHCGEVSMVGAWRCPPDSPWFHDSGPPRNHAFVFPRTPVRIERPRGDVVVTDTAVVTLYNRGDEYRREPVCDLGDECEWFVVTPELLDEAMDGVPGVSGIDRPFPVSYVFSNNELFLRQRRLVRALERREIDPHHADELVLDLLDRLVGESFGIPTPTVTDRHVRLVARARRVLAERFRERVRLVEVASACGVSPWFLARIFRRVTGTTVHGYHDRLRVRAALHEIVVQDDLSAVALDLGYSSHSHFTASFRRAFGVTPSGFHR